MLDVLLRNRIRVGVSLDGAAWPPTGTAGIPVAAVHFETVTRALALLQSETYRASMRDCCVPSPSRTIPVETYEALLGHAPPMIDFLLPHGTWSAPPPFRPPDASAPYADWLLRIFRRWTPRPTPETSIRLFAGIHIGCPGRVNERHGVRSVLGRPRPSSIDTDGSSQADRRADGGV